MTKVMNDVWKEGFHIKCGARPSKLAIGVLAENRSYNQCITEAVHLDRPGQALLPDP